MYTKNTIVKEMIFIFTVLVLFFHPLISSAQLNFDEKWVIENWWEANHYNMKDFVRFSPSNKSLYFPADTGYYTNGNSYTASKIFQISTETGEMISCSDKTEEIYEFELSALGNIYVTLQNKGITIRDAKTHQILSTILNPSYEKSYISNVLISNDEKYLIMNQGKQLSDYPNYQYENSLIVYDIQAEKTIKKIPSNNIEKWRMSPNGKTIAASVYSSDNNILFYLFNTTDWTIINTEKITGVTGINYSSDGVCVAVNTTRGCYIINTETMSIKKYEEQEVFGSPYYIVFLQDHDNYIVRYYDRSNVEYKNDLIVQRYYCDYEIIESNLYNNQFQMFAHFGANYVMLIPKVTDIVENKSESVSVVFSNNRLQIHNNVMDYTNAELYICDIRGNMVHSEQIQLNTGSVYYINMPCQNGVYFYRIVSGLKSFTGKFEVVR